jgi:hypothetical protein
MKTTLRKLEHVVAFRTLLPLRYVREELQAWVIRTYSIMYLAFALHAGCVLALGTSAYPSADVHEANESRAVIVRAVNQFWNPSSSTLRQNFLVYSFGRIVRQTSRGMGTLQHFGGKIEMPSRTIVKRWKGYCVS